MGDTLLGCLAALALSACAANYSIQSNSATGVQTTGAQVNVSTASALGTAIIVGVMLADGYHYYRLEPDGRKTPVSAPEPDPARKINAQDCTRPVDPGAGNLLCR